VYYIGYILGALSWPMSLKAYKGDLYKTMVSGLAKTLGFNILFWLLLRKEAADVSGDHLYWWFFVLGFFAMFGAGHFDVSILTYLGKT